MEGQSAEKVVSDTRRRGEARPVVILEYVQQKKNCSRRLCSRADDISGSVADAVSSLPRLSRTHPLPAPAEITTSTSFTELEAWETVARQHIELAKRAYDAWVFHREHFFAAGGDLVDRLEGRGEGPDGTDLARGAWEEVRLRGEKAEAVLKRKFHHPPFSRRPQRGIAKLTALPRRA